MAKNSKYPIDIDLGANGRVRFKTPDQVLRWVDRESEFWKPITVLVRAPTLHRYANETIDTFRNALNSIRQTAESWKANPSPEMLHNLVATIQQNLSLPVPNGQKRILHSAHPLSPVFREMVDAATDTREQNNALIAIGIETLSALQTERAQQEPALLQPLIVDILVRQGLTPTGVRAASKALQDLRRRTKGLDDEAELLVDEIDRSRQKGRKAMAKAVRQGRASHRQSVALADEKLEAALGKHEADIVQFKERILDREALKAPTAYWEGRAAEHTCRAKRAVTLLTIFLLVSGGAMIKGWHLLPSANSLVWKEIGIGVVGLTGLGLAAIAAIARMFYKSYLSNTHLANDARERVTMVETYHVLAERGKVDSTALNVLLARLFAPATDGMVREDLKLATPVDTVHRLLDKQ